MRRFRNNIAGTSNLPVTSIAANIILGIAMLGAILIGTDDFSVQSLAYDLSGTTELQGFLPPPGAE